MDSLSDQQLLRDYAERRSESAFAELVHRHVDLIYSAALRMVCDAHLAEDVTQGAFVALAQNARQLSDRPVLAGWLHRTARNLAANIVRSDVRRRAREQEAAAMNELLSAEPEAAWEKIAPLLDAALDDLSEPDRDALLLRYFERKSAHEIAQAFGISDDAAQKRVSRAVERLREFFSKRGVAIGASGLGIVMSAYAVQASPAGLGSAITTTVFAGTVTGVTAATHIATSWITMKLATGILIGAATAATATYLVLHNKAIRPQRENQALAAQKEKPSPDHNAAPVMDKGNEAAASQANPDEVLRLRGQVGVLRRETNELAQVQTETRSAQSRQLDEEMKRNASEIGMAIRLFTDSFENKVVLTNINQLRGAAPGAVHADVDLNTFEIIPQPTPLRFDWPEVAVFRERTPRQTGDGKWVRVYGMVDGQAVEQTSEDGNFDAWEKQHLMGPQPAP
jgi:RNA polymerase sigma factor (sigma-70 family)